MISPEDLQLLLEELPFYVNGTVSPAVRNRIDAALPVSAELREALDQERTIQSRLVAGTGELLAESEPYFESHQAAVLARVARQSNPAMESPKKSFAATLAFLNPRRWNPALALTLALAIPVQAALIASQSSTIAKLEKENFALASGPCADRDRTAGIVLEFYDDAPWKAIAALLDSEALVVVENGAFGVLNVRGDKTGAERSALIDRLKQSPLVSNAEPEA